MKLTYLKVRGFDSKSGARFGGIKNPVVVDLSAGIILLRTYHDPSRFFGEWWFTPDEMKQVIEYFARDESAFGEGRSQGKGILQATFAVRHEWGGNSPAHLGLVGAIRLTAPIKAFFGEGDSAPDTSQKTNLKPIQITDAANHQRGVRQVFFPEAWNFQLNYSVLEKDNSTDSDLIRMTKNYDNGPYYFES